LSERGIGCAEIQGLLPWVVNRTARPAEIVLFYGHVAVCPACRSELASTLAMAQRLRTEVGALAAAAMAGAPAGAGVRPGWTGLARRLPLGELPPSDIVRRLIPWCEAAGLPERIGDLLRLAMDPPTTLGSAS
jgi:hypothetical protein